MDFWRFSRFVHGYFGGCILQPEIETEGILDEGTKREQRVMDSVRVYVCMYAMRGCMHRRVGAMRKCDVCRYGMLCNVRCAGMMRYAMLCLQILAEIKGKMMKNGRRSLQNRGVSVILYDGFRKCFVNCKFTFYITLSSYLKKVKIPKTRKNHSKM